MPRFLSSGSLKIDIDVPILIMLFGVTLTESVLTNFLLFRTCHYQLGYNTTICTNITANKPVEDKVQPIVAVLLMAKTITTSVLPAILGMFLGPWSDKNGRKPLIISPTLGYAITYCILAVLTFFPNLSAWYLVASYIPVALMGGVSIMLTGVFCYISDTVPPKQRAVRLGLMQGFIAIGLLTGQLSSGPLYNLIGYLGVFLVGAAAYFIAAIYTIFIVKESVSLDQYRIGLKGIFDYEHLCDVLRAGFKKRPNNNRYNLWIMFITLALMMFAMDGNFEVGFLFVQKRFGWGLEEYAKFNSISLVVQIAGSMAGIYILNKVFNMSEVVLAMMAFASAIVTSMIRSTAVYGWQLYSAIPLSLMEGISGPMIRTLLSKTVPENESGKVFAMVSSIEALMPLLAAPVYTYIYNHTLTTFAGACYVVNAAVNLVLLILFSTLLCSKRNDMEDLVPVLDEEVQPHVEKDA